MEQVIETKGYGAKGSIFNSLSYMEFERKAPEADEVLIDVLLLLRRLPFGCAPGKK